MVIMCISLELDGCGFKPSSGDENILQLTVVMVALLWIY